jgi:hypothetical protein
MICKNLLAACLQIHDALKGLMPDIHALSIKRCWTKAQQAANMAQQQQQQQPAEPAAAAAAGAPS